MAKQYLPWESENSAKRAQASFLHRQHYPRTRKIFIPYNRYEDRPFGMKWATAYAMDELVKGIQKNHEDAAKESVALPEMTRSQIDAVLKEAWLMHYPITIQLSLKDHLGRYLEPFSAWFMGESNYSYFIVDDKKIRWEDVRHIELVKEGKWFDLDQLSDQRDKNHELD